MGPEDGAEGDRFKSYVFAKRLSLVTGSEEAAGWLPYECVGQIFVFECWTSRKTKWQPYPQKTQWQLNKSYLTAKEDVHFDLQGWLYILRFLDSARIHDIHVQVAE